MAPPYSRHWDGGDIKSLEVGVFSIMDKKLECQEWCPNPFE